MREVIEKQLKVDIDCDTVYFGDENRQVLRNLTERVDISHTTDLSLGAIAPTKIDGTIDDSAAFGMFLFGQRTFMVHHSCT